MGKLQTYAQAQKANNDTKQKIIVCLLPGYVMPAHTHCYHTSSMSGAGVRSVRACALLVFLLTHVSCANTPSSRMHTSSIHPQQACHAKLSDKNIWGFPRCNIHTIA